MNRFENKVAVVTGGNSVATARLLRDEGARVAIIGRDLHSDLRAPGRYRGTTLGIALAATLARIAPGAAAAPEGKPSVNTPVTTLQYGSTGVSDGVHGELKAAPAYGDLGRGPHGTFIRMPAGFVSTIHIHTEDYWGVVISGVAVNGVPGSTDVSLPVGSYWFQKGGERHVTKCISPNECLFLISQLGKFDYLGNAAAK